MNERTMTSEHLQCEWPAWVDAHRYELGPEPDETERDMVLAAEAERALLAELEYTGGDFDEAERAEFYAWLSSLEPTDDELESRDRVGGPFLGHEA